MPRCRRNRECGCRNHRPCTFYEGGSEVDPGHYCFDPAVDFMPDGRDPVIAQMHPWNHELPTCGFRRCNHPYAAYPGEVDFIFSTPEHTQPALAGSASCAPYTFENDITREQCYDTENGPPPAESTELCGDPWMSPVRLHEDWTFYKIPWRELRQEGYGKEFSHIELSAITMVRFTWTVGWLDVWIDDVRFYRNAR